MVCNGIDTAITRYKPNPNINISDSSLVMKSHDDDKRQCSPIGSPFDCKRQYVYCDSLMFSDHGPLPFPTQAASRLAEQRSKRYDDMLLSTEDTQSRLREFASIMGLLAPEDDIPTAA